MDLPIIPNIHPDIEAQLDNVPETEPASPRIAIPHTTNAAITQQSPSADLASPNVDPDIEAQINSVPETQLARIATAPTINTAISTADPTSPNVNPDVEAQNNSITEKQPTPLTTSPVNAFRTQLTTEDIALPNVDPDIEAQRDSVTETQHARSIATPPVTNTAFSQQQTTADPGLAKVDPDIATQINIVTETQPARIAPSTTNTALPQQPTSTAGPLPETTSINQDHNDSAAAQIADLQDEYHGDPSDGLWSIYLNEAGKQDDEVDKSWKGDTDGILVFTGLFSATVASFIIESYQNLSPNSSDTTNALLAQISHQMVNISNGIPLTSIAAQSSQSFTPSASAIRVNVLWFLSLILSLTCALSATLMQQWARRYRELTQRHVAFHKRGRMRAYIFKGIHRFGMARAVATMPTLLHASVFLFFAGLVDFLFPIYAGVAYAALGCIMVFAFAYGIITVLPNIYLNCPYATPLSALTWHLSQFSAIGLFWTFLKVEGLFRKSMSKFRSLANQHAPEFEGLKKWSETLKDQVNIRRQWVLQGMRNSVELSAFRADSKVVMSALEWTLMALDEDKEIEAFAAHIPGFFDSRVVPDPSLAVLPLMSHQPNTEPILGSRIHDLLKTCILDTSMPSMLDEKMRKNRLRVCVKCLWSFAKAYNEPESSQLVPSYFMNTLASPDITHYVRTEDDSGVRIIGRCLGALIVKKLVDGLESRSGAISDGELACLSAILGTKNHNDVRQLISQPGAVTNANMISLAFDEVGGLVSEALPPGVLGVVHQTLGILTQALSSEENTELSEEDAESSEEDAEVTVQAVQLHRPVAIISGSDGTFERILASRLPDLLNTCMRVTLPLSKEVRTTYLRTCLTGLWYIAYNELGKSVPLPSYNCAPLTNPETTRRIREEGDLPVRMIGHCVDALVVNKLTADINSRDNPVSNDELACLSAILDLSRDHVMLLLKHPGAIEFTNMFFFSLVSSFKIPLDSVPSYVLDMVHRTSSALFHALPPELNAEMRLNQSETLMNVSDGTSSLKAEICRNTLRVWNFTREYSERGNSVPLPPYVLVAFTIPEMTCRLRKEGDFAVRLIGHCVEALVVNKLVADINSRTDVKSRDDPVSNDELACLSAILDLPSDHVMLLLEHHGAIEFTSVFFFSLVNSFEFPLDSVPSYVLDMVHRTSSALFHALPPELKTEVRLKERETLMNVSDGTSSLKVALCRNVLHVWKFTKSYNERGNSVPLPPYVRAAFTNPELTRRLHKEGDDAVRLIGHCVEALVVNKLSAHINSRNISARTDELACISTILGTLSHDVKLCLSQPGTIEVMNLTSLFLLADAILSQPDQMPPHTHSILQQTLTIISRGLPAHGNAASPLDQSVALVDLSDDEFRRTIASHLGGLLNMCAPGASSLMEEVRISCLRMHLKGLWHCGKAYHQTSARLPSYFPLVLASPDITCHFHAEEDPVARITACCFGSLIVSKLIGDLESPISLSDCGYSTELACISAILGPQHREDLILPYQLRVINFHNLISVISGKIDALSTTAGMPVDVMNMVQTTFYMLANRLRDNMPKDQRRLLQEIYSGILNTLRSDQLKNETVKTLARLRQILEKTTSWSNHTII